MMTLYTVISASAVLGNLATSEFPITVHCELKNIQLKILKKIKIFKNTYIYFITISYLLCYNDIYNTFFHDV